MRLKISFTPPLADKAASFRQLAKTGLYEGLGRLAKQVGALLLENLRKNTPVSSSMDPRKRPGGRLRDATRLVQQAHYDGGISLKYPNETPYARYVIEGTRPHTIVPRRPGGVLLFYTADGWPVFTRRVQHPGTLANNFPQRTWDERQHDVREILRRTGREVIQEVVAP